MRVVTPPDRAWRLGEAVPSKIEWFLPEAGLTLGAAPAVTVELYRVDKLQHAAHTLACYAPTGERRGSLVPFDYQRGEPYLGQPGGPWLPSPPDLAQSGSGRSQGATRFQMRVALTRSYTASAAAAGDPPLEANAGNYSLFG